MILGFMLDEEKRGKPTIIVTGHKKTRACYFPALQAEGIATCAPTLFFLRHNGLIEQVFKGRPLEVALLGDSSVSYTSSDVRYRLTAKAKEALRA